MNEDLKDILSNNNNKEIDDQQLMNYLRKELSDLQTHELESSMAADPFLNDAVEGLQEIKPVENIGNTTLLINQELQRMIAKNKKNRSKRRWKDSPALYIVAICILLFMVLCFFLLKKRFFEVKHPKQTAIVTGIIDSKKTGGQLGAGKKMGAN